MPERLSDQTIVDSSFTLEKALGLRQQIEPPKEVLDRLGIVDVTYYSFDGNLHKGQVVLDRELLSDVKGAFDLISQIKFPIFSVIPAMDRSLMDDDEKAKTVNNSCGFNYRKVAGTDKLSNHSFGRAIDINPQINPYIKGEHSYGLDYDPTRLGTLTEDSVIVQYFKNRGWEWGGDWTDRKDYMHFEKPLTKQVEQETNVFVVKIDQSIPKDEYYKEQLQGVTPEAIFVLGGGNRERTDFKGKKSYKTSPYRGKFFPEKTGGAKARPIATVELSHYYPNAKIVTMSHRPNNLFQLAEQEAQPSDYPTFARVLSEDIKRAGVSKDRIIERPQSTSTLTEIMEVIIFTAQNDWQNVAVTTNDYQIERAQKLLDMLKDDEKRFLLKNQLQFLFKTGEESNLFNREWQRFEDALSRFRAKNARVVFVSAENILRRRNPHYETLIDELVELDGYKNVVEQERIGNEKITEGKYNFAQDSFREYILSKAAA